MTSPRRLVLLAIALAASSGAIGCAKSSRVQAEENLMQPAVVPTQVQEVLETLHGVELRDSYRWLEGDEQGKTTPAVSRWTDAQNARTRAVLDNLPGREGLERRMRQLLEVPAMGAPIVRGGRYFYTRRERASNQAALCVREGINLQERVLIDPEKSDASGLLTISWFAPSLDGQRVAVGLFRAGDENSTGRIIDVNTGAFLRDELKHKVDSVQWMPDGAGFFYARLTDADKPYSKQLCFHQIGHDPAQDPVLFEQYKEGPLATTWGPSLVVDRRGKWGVLGYWTSTRANDLWAVDLEHWRKTGEFIRREIIVGADAMSGGEIVGETFFMQTTLDAPNNRLIAVDMSNPSRPHWKELVPERPDATLADVSIAKGVLALRYDRNAQTQIRLIRSDGTDLGEYELPGIGSGALATDEDSTEAFLSFSSFNRPPTIYRTELPTGVRTIWHQLDVPVDADALEVKQVWYTSADGTKVSMFLVHRKGLICDGNNPALLGGYGGFSISMTPYFSATILPFLEAGGVFALPNLRGGGEYGQKWHIDGMLERKQNSFSDFIAAAEWLIEHKYTNPRRLGIQGGSNGGLLVGAALTQRPELFAAVGCHVPLLDMLRYQRFLMARYWVPEYGSSEDPTQFQYLLKYSPYQQVKRGTAYPAVMLTAGENDTRVHPLHARKMAAALQAATTSDPQSKPILLWVDREAGHGAGKPLSLRVRDATDQVIFMMWQLGML